MARPAMVVHIELANSKLGAPDYTRLLGLSLLFTKK